MTMPVIVTDIATLKTARANLAHSSVAVVMTMGALHAGHAALLHAARQRAGAVIATIFVNPLQFGQGEDLDRYPRTFEADLDICAAQGVDIVFVPTPEVVYPRGEPSVRVDSGWLGSEFEGASRPGHFAGVLTVVLKLLNLTKPDIAFFGEKDYQQLTLIRQMAQDFDIDIEIVGVPTVREPDGLALSSRNRYLTAEQRRTAIGLSAALRAGAETAVHGVKEALTAAHATLAAFPGIELDYLALTDQYLRPIQRSGAARLLIAAKVGTTRLIDNMAITVGGGVTHAAYDAQIQDSPRDGNPR